MTLTTPNTVQGGSICESGSMSPDGWPVVDVLDGDTIVVAKSRYELLRVRIYGIDAPEPANPRANITAQPFSEAATGYTRDLLLDRIVCLFLIGSESYNRVVAKVHLDGSSVGNTLVREGLSWWDYRLMPEDEELAQLQRAARKNGIGLWSEKDPVPPWEWRSRPRSRGHE